MDLGLSESCARLREAGSAATAALAHMAATSGLRYPWLLVSGGSHFGVCVCVCALCFLCFQDTREVTLFFPYFTQEKKEEGAL